MISGKEHAIEYVPGERFVVEITDKQTGKVFYTKRIARKIKAEKIRTSYNMLKDVLAIIIDTKTASSENWW